MRLLLQTLVILLLGSALGAADAFYYRPIKIGREAPPPVDVTSRKTATPAPPSDVVPDITEPAEAPPQKSSGPPTPITNPTAPAAFTPTPKAALPAGHITLDEGKALFDNQATFIDSRNLAEYEKGHIQGAFRLELHDFLATASPPVLAIVPRDGNVVVYCKGGDCDESDKVAEMLTNSGYKRVYVLHDGLPGWLAMGWPHETGPGMGATP